MSHLILFTLIFSSHAQKIEVTSETPGERVIKSFSSGAQAWSIYGEAEGFNGHGVVGIATGDESRGVYGVGDIGIYGSASNGNALAGYFSGDVEINGPNSELIFPDGTSQTTAFVAQNLFYTKSFLTGPIAANSSNVVNGFCNERDDATGGGWDAYRNEGGAHDAGSNTYYNKPTTKLINSTLTGGWEIGFRNNSTHFYRVEVFVICADVKLN